MSFVYQIQMNKLWFKHAVSLTNQLETISTLNLCKSILGFCYSMDSGANLIYDVTQLSIWLTFGSMPELTSYWARAPLTTDDSIRFDSVGRTPTWIPLRWLGRYIFTNGLNINLQKHLIWKLEAWDLFAFWIKWECFLKFINQFSDGEFDAVKFSHRLENDFGNLCIATELWFDRFCINSWEFNETESWIGWW